MFPLFLLILIAVVFHYYKTFMFPSFTVSKSGFERIAEQCNRMLQKIPDGSDFIAQFSPTSESQAR